MHTARPLSHFEVLPFLSHKHKSLETILEENLMIILVERQEC